MTKPIVVSLLFTLLVAACSNLSRPAPTEFSTEVSAHPPNETPAVALEWNGIPIMPGATAGEGDEESYVFAVRATPQQIREYYELELSQRGWQSRVEEADASLILVFTRDAAVMLTVNILAKGDECLVLLVK